MTKPKTVFYCQECGHESAKWLGQCPACRKWNTFVEEKVLPSAGKSAGRPARAGENKPVGLDQVSMEEEIRLSSGIGELDRVLGGGIVEGSLTLVGGDPGIGKSTLLLQMAMGLGQRGVRLLYVSGEESLRQIKLRATRLGESAKELLLFCETDLRAVREAIEAEKPKIVIIDSIQTMCDPEISSAPGSVSQIREATAVFLRIAKEYRISVFLIGHVTKEGTVAGPRVLEHMVDTVLYFEGDRFASYRILRAVKNRFGATNEIGVFEMREAGLQEVKNPSEFMLQGRPLNAPGSIISCAMEGSRPLLIEIQALVCDTAYGFPKRQANGTDHNRVGLLMAMLEKRVGLHTGASDAYVNLAGGMKIEEPALDLGIVLAVASGYLDLPVSQEVMAFGEVGLSGEVRGVKNPGERIAEAKKLGFGRVILPAVSVKSLEKPEGLTLLGVENVGQAIQLIREGI